MAPRPIQIKPGAGPPIAGFKRNQFGRELAQKHNAMYTANLKIALDGLPKYVIGTFAATVLDKAVRVTKHDSGRFAANWNLSFGSSNPDPVPSPLIYGETGPKFGSIGEKGDQKFRLAVMMAKRTYYGYRKGTGDFMALTKGLLAEKLFGASFSKANKGSPGAYTGSPPPRIVLYNPFMRDNRKSGWWPLTVAEGSASRPGKSYPFYAMKGQGGTVPGIDDGLVAKIGSGALQAYIRDSIVQIREAVRQGTLINPLGITLK